MRSRIPSYKSTLLRNATLVTHRFHFKTSQRILRADKVRNFALCVITFGKKTALAKPCARRMRQGFAALSLKLCSRALAVGRLEGNTLVAEPFRVAPPEAAVCRNTIQVG